MLEDIEVKIPAADQQEASEVHSSLFPQLFHTMSVTREQFRAIAAQHGRVKFTTDTKSIQRRMGHKMYITLEVQVHTANNATMDFPVQIWRTTAMKTAKELAARTQSRGGAKTMVVQPKSQQPRQDPRGKGKAGPIAQQQIGCHTCRKLVH